MKYVGTMKRKRGWVFVNDETQVEVHFASPEEYRNAESAVEGFDTPYHFDLYFRDSDMQLHAVTPESTPEDFV
jgi:hypothetical protein